MNIENKKCVMIIDENLPVGIIANTSAILGITMGMKLPDVVGDDIKDLDCNIHNGIIKIPIPVLKGDTEAIHNIRKKLFSKEYSDLTVVDFSDLAQGCKTYDEYIAKMAKTFENKLKYIGIAICGSKKKVNKLTGNMPLLR
ncbi:MAG: DUF2000 domain-containing protein [Acetobacter sp.]|nr:DUF2000 domain-containing protein [Bacteroides sp.]MCM1340252.1 DUF2000 domain-containing protein [Acetobacter sp.]MCM1432796.1 DUF2000 domain-containing protein [Clostridiales bacterium]